MTVLVTVETGEMSQVLTSCTDYVKGLTPLVFETTLFFFFFPKFFSEVLPLLDYKGYRYEEY